MVTSARLLLLSTACLLPAAAMAQDSVTNFRLVQDPKNITGCTSYDSTMTRVHTFTVKGGQAELKSAGGINERLKVKSPNVYEGLLQLAGVHLDIVADLASTPKTLTVTEKKSRLQVVGEARVATAVAA